MRGIVTIIGIIVVIYVAWWFWKRNVRAALIAKLSDKFGNIPGLSEKSDDELREMWESTKD